jgi:hypothetical protein
MARIEPRDPKINAPRFHALAPPVRAAALRQEAREACQERTWSTCLDKLNEARALDPSGDQPPDVQSLRRSAGDPPRAP